MTKRDSKMEKERRMIYIYDLPYFERMELCNLLNANELWVELAGKWMEFDRSTIESLREEKNPPDKLLELWGEYNHKITELVGLLYKMQQLQPMMILKPFVESKYHALINKVKMSHESAMAQRKELKHQVDNVNDSPQGPSKQENIEELKRKNVAGKGSGLSFDKTSPLPQISYHELTVITDGWDKQRLLGRGGFGSVYRATWRYTEVAVKKIERRGPDSDASYLHQLQQSLREITILNCRPHDNILPLYAFSIGGDAPCLVTPIMINGSLQDRLQMRQGTLPLTWLQRHEIAKGTARGLDYLHKIGKKPLIHGDIKSANILLDKNFEPRIGDFGLAREGSEKDSIMVSKIQGTRPYLPDEFLYNKKLSTKIDTYSYGVVMFEMATGLPVYDDSRQEHKYLKDFINNWSERGLDLSLLMDKKAGSRSIEVYNNLIILGKWCCNRLSENRPEMAVVFQKLDAIVLYQT